MENVLSRSSPKDAAAQQCLGLPTGGTDVSYHEDPGEPRPGAAQAYGRPHLDPLKFVYQPRIGVEYAIIFLLNRVYTHLDKPASTVRVTFFDFSSAFNTNRPTG